jgi:sulfite reductase alpha subunit-like flavoprotein
MLAYIFIALAVVFLVVYLLRKDPAPDQSSPAKPAPPQQEVVELGRVRIYFGSQTGTAAKLAEQLAEEGTEQGFKPEVIDLK